MPERFDRVTFRRRAVLAAIARRERLLRVLALAAAGCARDDRDSSRGNTLIVTVDSDRPLCPDFEGESLVFLPLVRQNELSGDRQPCLATHWEHSADWPICG